MKSFFPKNLSNDEIVAYQNEFDLVTKDLDVKEIIWKEMSGFFEKSTPGQDFELWGTFFKWYVALNWELFNSLDPASTIRAIERQIPVAVILGHDVVKTLIFYLDNQTSYYDQQERMNLYTKMRRAFFESPCIVGNLREKQYTIRDLVSEKKELSRSGATSLEAAELDSKIKKLLQTKDLENILATSQDEAVENLLEILEFFNEVNPEDIFDVVEGYTHPNLFDKISLEESKNVKFETQSMVAASTSPSPSPYLALKSALEAEFPRDASGHFLNMAEVLGRLEAIAEDSGDERVKELYYFNEATGGFEWNEGMLNG